MNSPGFFGVSRTTLHRIENDNDFQLHFTANDTIVLAVLEVMADAPEKSSRDHESALDRARLSGRAVNAIERVWGADAKRRDLLAPDAHDRLRQLRGIGERTIREIEEAVVAWGFTGIGGKRRADPFQRVRLTHRGRLDAALRALGTREILVLLSDICGEHIAACRQRLTRKLSQRRRRRYERAVAYYVRCKEHLDRCLENAPTLQRGEYLET